MKIYLAGNDLSGHMFSESFCETLKCKIGDKEFFLLSYHYRKDLWTKVLIKRFKERQKT